MRMTGDGLELSRKLVIGGAIGFGTYSLNNMEFVGLCISYIITTSYNPLNS